MESDVCGKLINFHKALRMILPSRRRRSAGVPPLFIVVLASVLPGCAAQVAGPGYGGLPALEAEVEGMRFILRLRPDRAEAVRVSPMFPPNFREVARRAQIAVARESGCMPDWVIGDPAMLEIGLSCDGRPAPKKPRGRHTDCDFLVVRGVSQCG
ncbi:hypothetical protein [Alloyangia pacifica]|nr:hypothetical protein [Alloyangia pacifica]